MINPQSGVVEDKWECSIKLIPLLLVENARKTGGVQAATEDMRNEIVKRMDNVSPVTPSLPGTSYGPLLPHNE